MPRALGTKEFIQRARGVHGNDKYDYSRVKYSNLRTPVEMGCNKCRRDFHQAPNIHLRGGGCPCRYREKRKKKKRWKKACRGHSRKQIRWLNGLMKKRGEDIRHAENGGEFRIPGTKYKVDGYCEETNTIYEFYGDYWHGNPDVYPRDKVNLQCGVTFGELYDKTLERERELEGLGYKLETIWENDRRRKRR